MVTCVNSLGFIDGVVDQLTFFLFLWCMVTRQLVSCFSVVDDVDVVLHSMVT